MAKTKMNASPEAVQKSIDAAERRRRRKREADRIARAERKRQYMEYTSQPGIVKRTIKGLMTGGMR